MAVTAEPVIDVENDAVPDSVRADRESDEVCVSLDSVLVMDTVTFDRDAVLDGERDELAVPMDPVALCDADRPDPVSLVELVAVRVPEAVLTDAVPVAVRLPVPTVPVWLGDALGPERVVLLVFAEAESDPVFVPKDVDGVLLPLPVGNVPDLVRVTVGLLSETLRVLADHDADLV